MQCIAHKNLLVAYFGMHTVSNSNVEGFSKKNTLGHCRAESKRKGSIIEPVHEISNNLVCATSKSSDQHAHTRSLIRAFASRLSFL